MQDKKAVIYQTGKELFKNEFKDTNVAEIMRRAGFATGTFYSFYPSKERLFMEIFNDENADPILKEWYNRDVIGIVRQWQAEGRIRNDIGAEMVMAIFTALIRVDLSKEEIGLKFFHEIMDYLACFIMKGLCPDTAKDPGTKNKKER